MKSYYCSKSHYLIYYVIIWYIMPCLRGVKMASSIVWFQCPYKFPIKTIMEVSASWNNDDFSGVFSPPNPIFTYLHTMYWKKFSIETELCVLILFIEVICYISSFEITNHHSDLPWLASRHPMSTLESRYCHQELQKEHLPWTHVPSSLTNLSAWGGVSNEWNLIINKHFEVLILLTLNSY